MKRPRRLWIVFPLIVCPIACVAGAAAAQTLRYTTSWVGNSFGGTKPPGFQYHKHVQISADDVFIASDGTVYTDTGWDEDGLETGIYKNGDVIGALDSLSHGWGRVGGGAVTASAQYVFAAMAQNGDDGTNTEKNANGRPQYPPARTQWFAIRRFFRDGRSAPFPDGDGWKDDMQIVNTVTKPDKGDYRDEGVVGLAADSAGRLFVSDPAHNRIRVYDAATMAAVAGWPCTRPGKLAIEDDGHLWVLQGTGQAARIIRFDTRTGKPLPQTIPGTPGWDPQGITIDPKGRLIVADSGPDQDIKFYTALGKTPKLAFRFGRRGGVFSSPAGRIGPARFNMPVGAGSDAAGNVYIYSRGSVAGGGTVLESYSANATRNWRLLGLEFIDCAEPDPASPNDVYSKEEHFKVDYAEAPGKDWAYRGYTVNRLKYPDDPRLHTQPTSVFVRRIRGRLFLFTTDMYSSSLTVSRFSPKTDDECAVPSVLFARSHVQGDWPRNQPARGEWIWRDGNGNGAQDAGEYDGQTADAPSLWGWSVDSRGGVWQATDQTGIRYFPCQGLDSVGNPIYSYATMQTWTMPPAFTELCRADYVPETDTLYLAGYTTKHPHAGGEWGTVGTEVLRFDGWNAGSRTPAVRMVLPYTQTPWVYIKAMSVAGDNLFAVESRDPERVFVYNARTGVLRGTMQPDATVGKSSGWVDMPYGIRATRRADGGYLVFVEDDLDAKVIVYHWMPDGHS